MVLFSNLGGAEEVAPIPNLATATPLWTTVQGILGHIYDHHLEGYGDLAKAPSMTH